MTKLIKGEKVIAQLWVTDTWYTVFCAKSCEFSMEQDELEVTSIVSGSSREYLPGMMNATLSVSGISTIDNSEGKIAITYLMQQSVRQQVLEWRIYLEADDGDTLEATFSGIIKSTAFSKDGFSYMQSSLVVRVSGDPEFNEIVPSPETPSGIFADYWQTVNGQNYITGASSGEYDGTNYTLLFTDTILGVDVEGTGFDLVSGTPTAGTRECQFLDSPVRIVFPADLIFDGSQRVYVLFQR